MRGRVRGAIFGALSLQPMSGRQNARAKIVLQALKLTLPPAGR